MGAVARLAVENGACAGVTDVSSSDTTRLPRVGTTLRVGWPLVYIESYVEMGWGTDVPLDTSPTANEHHHVYKSEDPANVVTAVTFEPPYLQNGFFGDLAADLPDTGSLVWFYLVFTSDACENDNRAEDSFRFP